MKSWKSDEPVIFVHIVQVPCSAPEDEDGKEEAPNADDEKPAEKTEEEPDEKADESKTPAEPEEGKAEK